VSAPIMPRTRYPASMRRGRFSPNRTIHLLYHG
jgi:hypothetical protein